MDINEVQLKQLIDVVCSMGNTLEKMAFVFNSRITELEKRAEYLEHFASLSIPEIPNQRH
jgi:hypothetical protein